MFLVYSHETMETLAERIEARRKELELSKTDVWKGASLSSGSYSHWMNGGSLTGENLLKVAKVLKVNPEWLQTGKGKKEFLHLVGSESLSVIKSDTSLTIPLLAAVGSMGNGNENEHADLVIDVLRITKQWADKTLSNVTKISNLRFIHAIGDSMHPTFNDGDILLVDTGVKSVTSDSVYVLDAHNRLFIKRVRGRMDGTFEISSDNPSVKTVDVLNGDNQVEIKGRVVWVWNGKRV